jgi:hypothetical protein
MNGLTKGILSKKGALIGAVREIVTAANTEFDRLNEIHSPSKVWYRKGAYLGEGQVLGMKSTIPKIENATNEITQVTNPVPSGVGGGASGSSQSIGKSQNIYNNGNGGGNTFNFDVHIHDRSGGNDRELARLFKEAARELMNEANDSFGRKNPRVTIV